MPDYNFGNAGDSLREALDVPLPQARPQQATPGLITAGNIDLANRPQVQTPQGTATVRSMSFNENGREVLIPTVHPSGYIMSPQQAIDYYRQTGQHLGIFDTPDNADRYAQQLHEAQARQFGLDR
jgi:hypothetical protein